MILEEITQEQERNLRLLAQGLRERLDPARKFDMRNFSDLPGQPVEDSAIKMSWWEKERLFSTMNECGTVGCAVGHATYLVEPKLKGESFNQYSERLFGLEPSSEYWDWCFSEEWTYRDNTPAGAASRIEWMLDKSLPDDWYDDLQHTDAGDSTLASEYAGYISLTKPSDVGVKV